MPAYVVDGRRVAPDETLKVSVAGGPGAAKTRPPFPASPNRFPAEFPLAKHDEVMPQ
jgi:hypothetical protein